LNSRRSKKYNTAMLVPGPPSRSPRFSGITHEHRLTAHSANSGRSGRGYASSSGRLIFNDSVTIEAKSANGPSDAVVRISMRYAADQRSIRWHLAMAIPRPQCRGGSPHQWQSICEQAE
jgi:hypothetical protein